MALQHPKIGYISKREKIIELDVGEQVCLNPEEIKNKYDKFRS